MMPYDKTQKSCKYGEFDFENHAGYNLTAGDKLVSPWYYVYNNRKVLLYVDQNGPVKVQYQPPHGILVFKREMGETQSKWQVWVSSPDLNEGVAVSNFNSPRIRHDLKKPEFSVNWTPEMATYTSKYDTADIITKIFVPSDKATVCMKTTVVNKNNKDMDFTVTPAAFPYVNIPQMVAWDLPEWYLSTKVKNKGEMLTIHGQMNDPHMIKADNRSVTFNIDYEADAGLELDMSKFAISGNFLTPDLIINNGEMKNKMADADGTGFGSHQAVWAAQYKFNLKPGESKTFTQVLTIQEDVGYNDEENEFERAYFDDEKFKERYETTHAFYSELFSKRTIKTSNPLYNNFINEFTPLQMFWVCSLDRGWPSCMRGIRDASQDFMGMVHLNPEWTKQCIKEMFEHQQVDGWMPRQISTVSRTAPHDMRYYCDGGAFLLELIDVYMTTTRDVDMLFEKVYWLDSDEMSTVLEHVVRCTQFYLDEKNIGEHGLCKVWFGDWWDPMDKIGMDGRGETVTVTAQMIYNLENLCKLYKWLYDLGRVDDSYLELIKKYQDAKEKFTQAMHKYAFNKEGFFNGYFNDNGKWLLSEKDPDGEKRVYLVSNAWSIISGCATKEMTKSVIETVEKECFGRIGYNTKSKGYAVYVDKAGRVGNGTSPGTGPYNHAQSFFARACCECGDAERAYKTTRYILPIEEEYAPVEMTFAPPYAIANSYSNGDKFLHRVGFQFLSGTVSYVLRTVYNFFMGITFGYDGLTLKPCIPEAFGDCSVDFTYLGKKFTVNYKKTENKDKTAVVNGKAWETTINEKSGLHTIFIKDSEMLDENIIEMQY